MTWLKVDDAMPENPKIIGLAPATKWALMELWCYAARHHTDGYVIEAAAKRYAKPRVLNELAGACLIHRNGAGYVIHDWTDHNITSAEAATRREATAERQRKWREEHRSMDGTFHE